MNNAIETTNVTLRRARRQVIRAASLVRVMNSAPSVVNGNSFVGCEQTAVTPQPTRLRMVESAGSAPDNEEVCRTSRTPTSRSRKLPTTLHRKPHHFWQVSPFHLPSGPSNPGLGKVAPRGRIRTVNFGFGDRYVPVTLRRVWCGRRDVRPPLQIGTLACRYLHIARLKLRESPRIAVGLQRHARWRLPIIVLEGRDRPLSDVCMSPSVRRSEL